MKVLIIKPSSFGDIVQALPVATGLKRAWEGVEVHWVTFDSYETLLRGHPAIDRLWVVPKKRWLRPKHWAEMAAWVRELQAERFDLALDLQGLLRSGLMTWASGAKRKIGLWGAREGAILFYNEKIIDPPPPAQEKYLEFLRHLGIWPQPHDFQLEAPPLAVTALENRSYLALHPYSRWRTKLWPWRYYAEVMRALPDQFFVLVGEGPWFPVEAPNCFDLRNKLPLPQLMAVLKNSQALVSTDSGPAHLAAALGTPTVVLFGATDWRKTRPSGQRVAVLRYQTPCSPCLKRSCGQAQPMMCMSAITPRQVVDKLREMLAFRSEGVQTDLFNPSI